LASEVVEGDTKAFDEAVLRALRSSLDPTESVGDSWLRRAARNLSSLGSNTVLLVFTLAAAGFLLLVRDVSAAALVLAATWGGQLVCLALKASFNRSRPDLVPHWDQISTASFPSGHAMMSAVVYLTLAVRLVNFVHGRKLKTYIIGVAATLTFLVGVSRLVLGVHYPTDVMAGWTAGLVWSLACGLAASAYHGWRERSAIQQSSSGRQQNGTNGD
jgi:undecaprenyl-diphosphatase